MMFPRTARQIAAVGAIASMLALSACSSDSDSAEGDVTLKVLTWRTDLVEDGTFDEYAERFTEANPTINVEFEGITDYEGEVKTRMSTDNYGDVLGIVGTVQPNQLGDFFEPLGTVDEIEETYRFVREKAYDGQVYGIPVVGNTQGIVYNKNVWAEAGLTDYPTTPEDFIAALEKIKSSTDAVPMYTNYAAGWTLTQWEGHRGEISADPNYVNSLLETDNPWTQGSDHFVIDSLLYDTVAAGLIEEDPTTTDWELSKDLLATGDVATMVLGSWAIVQMQQAAVDNGGAAEDIGYMPFPYQVDGKFHGSVGGDYNQAINVNSEHKEEARLWIDWFNNESGYAESQGGLSPLKDSPEPQVLQDFAAAGVEYVEQLPAEPGMEGKIDEIDNTAEIGLWQDMYRKRIIDAARGQADETKEDIFADLNARWKEARAEVMG
ncbi:ABC transporter substrate-binding protein [Jonesia quinghaiensis]|uniref:ABC transporter substrate-binding protein n=1 Tax=Jonesia quinghaiensis TaxID=262806 RepID=UPI0004166D83|nr:ABC transporter substrate-binding protein [Jonesia quinghaiensis]